MNIAQAKARVPVEHVIGSRVALQLRGAVFADPCPFHDDRGRPNLVVFPKTQTWQCFACGVQGDVINCPSRIQGVSLREAIALIGRESHHTRIPLSAGSSCGLAVRSPRPNGSQCAAVRNTRVSLSEVTRGANA